MNQQLPMQQQQLQGQTVDVGQQNFQYANQQHPNQQIVYQQQLHHNQQLQQTAPQTQVMQQGYHPQQQTQHHNIQMKQQQTQQQYQQVPQQRFVFQQQQNQQQQQPRLIRLQQGQINQQPFGQRVIRMSPVRNVNQSNVIMMVNPDGTLIRKPVVLKTTTHSNVQFRAQARPQQQIYPQQIRQQNSPAQQWHVQQRHQIPQQKVQQVQQQVQRQQQQAHQQMQQLQPPQQPNQYKGVNQHPTLAQQTSQVPQHNEILYNVEHVFQEEGREVRKMPIKIGDETIWVETCSTNDTTGLDDQFMIPLHSESPGTIQTQQQQPLDSSSEQNQRVNHMNQSAEASQLKNAPLKRKSNEISVEDKEKAISRVVDELISPQVVGEEMGGISAAVIRKWIKDAKKQLPSKYKIKGSTDMKTNPAIGSAITQQGIPGESNNTHSPVIPSQSNAVRPPQSVGNTQAPRPVLPGYGGSQTPSVLRAQQQMRPMQQQQPVLRHVIVNRGFQSAVAVTTQLPVTKAQSEPRVQLLGPPNPDEPEVRQTPQKPISQQPVSTAKPTTSLITTPSTTANLLTNASTPTKTGNQGQLQQESYVPKFIPGFLVVCKNCGFLGNDFNRCERCRKKIGDDFKKVPDSTKKSFSESDGGKTTDLRGIRITPKPRKKKVADEPVCIALSSDDEDEGGNQDNKETNPEKDAKPSMGNDATDEAQETVTDEMIMGSPSKGDFFALQCRSIRLGSYKSMPKEKSIFTQNGIHLRVPDIWEDDKVISVNIKKTDVLQLKASFNRSMPVLFFTISPSACERVRRVIGMKLKSLGYWLDLASEDETQRCITILPDRIADESRKILRTIYESDLEEIEAKEANELLVKLSPKTKDQSKIKTLALQYQKQQALEKAVVQTPPQPQKLTYCTFPMNSSPSVSLTAEDYLYLEDESFLNDNIIEFYILWIKEKIMSEVDKQKVFFFNTFFYNTLTRRPIKSQNRVHPVEDNPNLSPAEKRYERVKRWTKRVNIFEKDFVFVPINEHSHWYLAVICFPGLFGAFSMEDGCPVTLKEPPRSKKLRPKRPNMNGKFKVEVSTSSGGKKVLQIGSTSIIPINNASLSNFTTAAGGDDSDRDEAEASDSEMLCEEYDPPHVGLKISDSQENNGPTADEEMKESDAGKEVKSKLYTQDSEGKEEIVSEENEVKGKLRKELSDVDDEIENETLEKNETEKQESGNDVESKSESKSTQKKEDESSNDDKELKNSERVPVKRPCILIFDSLNTGSRARVVATLRDYLKCEYKAKTGKTWDFNKENMRGNCPKVPQQPNFSDCGLYLLQYIESFFKNPVKDFTLPLTTLKDWFPKDYIRHKRSEIASIIRNLASEQNPGKKIEFPNIVFSPVTGSGYSDEEEDELDEDGNEPANQSEKSDKASEENAEVVTKNEEEREKTDETTETEMAESNSKDLETSSDSRSSPRVIRILPKDEPETTKPSESSVASSTAALENVTSSLPCNSKPGMVITKKEGKVFLSTSSCSSVITTSSASSSSSRVSSNVADSSVDMGKVALADSSVEKSAKQSNEDGDPPSKKKKLDQDTQEAL